MRDPKEGISLAAITAKETTHSNFSGTGGGLGLGTGGLGVFFGGISGTRQDQTQRAKNFVAPEKASPNLLRMYAPLLSLLGVGMLSGMIGGLMLRQDTGDAVGLSTATTVLDSSSVSTNSNVDFLIVALRFVVPAMALIAAIIWLFFSSGKAKTVENERIKKHR
ncbi:hypothetical protein [Tatumella sp. JGM130]|uniref:hypothetical protein n=1 Tax=Tatumella sp. JGM130 TaxID=2799797 RepID=UPI0020116E4F|nr:hypothetical protein [Tatumella sp. JGM130]